MIQLKLKTEFHFDSGAKVYAKMDDVVARLVEMKCPAAAITDCTAFGHVAFYNALKKEGIKPLLGAQVLVSGIDADRRHKMTLLARNDGGLREMYRLMSMGDALDADALIKSSASVLKFAGTTSDKKFLKQLLAAYVDIDPYDHALNREKLKVGLPPVLTSDNSYVRIGDRPTFELFGGAVRIDPMQPQHILTEAEARALFKYAPLDAAITTMRKIAFDCNVTLPRAENVRLKGDLEKLCRAGIKSRGYTKRWTKEYEARLRRELDMIASKNFADYFLVLSDLIREAKKTMLVGPARGSSAGSIVCFLTYITDIDPLEHGLVFERFIDITRADLPDIDVDFPDEKREQVIQYLRDKYGAPNVARIGTTQTWQPKSILTEVSMRLNIPKWEMDELKNVMIERSSGDARASLCLLDTLTSMEAGAKMLKKYPIIKRATAFEGHAKYSGTHAAGVIICNDAVVNYCALNGENVAHIDKKDAEKLNILKLDLLGLRTLSVLEDCIAATGEDIDPLKIPLDDASAFALINDGKFAGIFQFEGDAVQMLARRMDRRVDRFADIVALGALARPGPLNSGGATTFVDRRIGKEPVEYYHKKVREYTEETMGIIVYQEQVMIIGREIGDLDWEDVSELRKAMSKSKGEEFFNQYWIKFRDGAQRKHKLSEKEARNIWNNMQTMGSWAFNKSHAVAYGLLSYWCAWLKAHHPLAFAAATLRHSKSDDQVIQILRELSNDDIPYVAFDKDRSEMNWSVVDGQLLGGFLNIKGVGETKAEKLMEERASGAWSKKTLEFFDTAEIQYTDVYPTASRFAALYENPRASGFRIPKVSRIKELDGQDTFAFIGLLKTKNPRDLNEYVFQVKRTQEGKPALIQGKPTQYLNLMLEDDTGKAYATVSWQDFEGVGRDVVDNGVVDKTWYICQGRRNRIGRINITWMKELKA